MERKKSKDDKPDTKVKDRWLLTRKTFRYMRNAGKKLFPEGVNPSNPQDVSKVEEHFQDLSRRCHEYILQHPEKGESLPASPTFDSYLNFEFADEDDEDDKEEIEGAVGFSRDRAPSLSDIARNITSHFYNDLLQTYGPATIEKVATKLLEDQFSPFPEYPYYEEDGELVEQDGIFTRNVAIQTEPYMDMCSQIHKGGTTEHLLAVGSETRAKTEDDVRNTRTEAQKDEDLRNALEDAHVSEDYDNDVENGTESTYVGNTRVSLPHQLSLQGQVEHNLLYKDGEYNFPGPKELSQPPHKNVVQSKTSHDMQSVQQLQSTPNSQSTLPLAPELLQQQQQPPVLLKFWARRLSIKKGDILVNPTGVQEKTQCASPDKDRGMVAAKLASLEAVSSTGPADGHAAKNQQAAASTSSSLKASGGSQNFQKPTPSKTCDKKKQSVFKMGLKCDIDAQPSSPKKEIDKKKVDRFKTLNYDKTLRNIKSKWVPSKEEESFIQSIQNRNVKEYEKNLRIQERKNKLKPEDPSSECLSKAAEQIRKEKAGKKKAKSTQTGETLPAFVLESLRVSTCKVEVTHAPSALRRLRRLSSKTDSMTESESSMLASGMNSPRFPITLLGEQCNRDLTVSESEAYKLSQMGIPYVVKPPLTEESHDLGGNETQGSSSRSIFAAIQVSGYIAQILHSIKGSRLFHSHGGSQSSDKSRSVTKSILQSFLPAAMQRGRTPTSGHASRLVGKKLWRTRSKSQSRASAATTSVWTPNGKGAWMSVTGNVVMLEATTLTQLSELERITLQTVAASRLQTHNLGCAIKIPKESTETTCKKRRPMLLKRKAISGGFFDGKKDENKNTATGCIFGLPLTKCIESERQRGRDMESLASITTAGNSGEYCDDSINVSRKSSHASFTSLLEGAKQTMTGSLESLNLERKRPSLGSSDLLIRRPSLASTDLLSTYQQLQVPKIVSACCKHIENFGLHTLGIFRVSSSKKRVRQLREEFDNGKDVVLSDEHCPHDVATLLKEFLRDLPEPLLTRELYEALLCSQKIRHRKLQLQSLQHLVQLLPPSNRDTLRVLLNFLAYVAEHSGDTTSSTGEVLPGNKMDSCNLATVFAPNILHQIKPGSLPLTAAEMKSSADERGDIINVVRCMIDHNKDLFDVSVELLEDTYESLMDTHPEALDVLLRRKSSGPDEFDFDMETASSVFEEMDHASLPRSPTDPNEFERLRLNIPGDDVDIGTKKEEPREMVEKTHLRRSALVDASGQQCSQREKKTSGDMMKNDEKNWFRRREKSDSIDKLDEDGDKARWFRKKEKNSPKEDRARQNIKDMQYYVLPQNGQGNRRRLNSQDSIDSQGGITIISTSHNKANGEKLKTSQPRVRRLSSPDLDGEGVITASLKIQVPFPQQSSLAFNQENIPYIEDSPRKDSTSHSSRRRTGSNDSFLGQPITGSMSFQPLCQRDIHKASHDSILSSSSMGFYTMSPSERNTPNSDMPYVSGSSTPLSGAFSPPSMCLSPDSGTPGLSPPGSPPPLHRRRRRTEDSPPTYSSPLSHSATHTYGIKPIPPQRSRSKGLIASISPLSRSRTSEIIKSCEAKSSKDSSASSTSKYQYIDQPTAVCIKSEKKNIKKYTRRRYTGDKRHIEHLPEVDTTIRPIGDPSKKTWRRWDIIASDPADPETYV